MTQDADSFKANYDILKEVAETLRNQKEPDIDALIPMVDRALASYKVCKDRITAVKTAFGERLPEGLPE
jgi:exodeoxyribonuclease VII small subunit